VSSSDVIHSFWIPDMLFKRDAIPGRVSSFDLTPSSRDVPGALRRVLRPRPRDDGVRVRIVSPAEYQRWLADEAKQ